MCLLTGIKIVFTTCLQYSSAFYTCTVNELLSDCVGWEVDGDIEIMRMKNYIVSIKSWLLASNTPSNTKLVNGLHEAIIMQKVFIGTLLRRVGIKMRD